MVVTGAHEGLMISSWSVHDQNRNIYGKIQFFSCIYINLQLVYIYVIGRYARWVLYIKVKKKGETLGEVQDIGPSNYWLRGGA